MFYILFCREVFSAMIINSNNPLQRNILTNRCFYLTIAQIVHDFEQKGYQNAADEAAKVISAYHLLVQKKSKNTYNKDYNEAFARIDQAIKTMANQVFYTYDTKSFDAAYAAFKDFDYINAILGRQRLKRV